MPSLLGLLPGYILTIPRLNGLFQFLGRAKRYFLARLDLDDHQCLDFYLFERAEIALAECQDPVSRILSPFISCRVASAIGSPKTSSTCFLGRLWVFANSAAICLNFIVACEVVFAGAASEPNGITILQPIRDGHLRHGLNSGNPESLTFGTRHLYV